LSFPRRSALDDGDAVWRLARSDERKFAQLEPQIETQHQIDRRSAVA